MMMITKVDDEVEDIVIKLSLGVAGNVEIYFKLIYLTVHFLQHYFVPWAESCSKPISYIIALNQFGEEYVHKYVGTEPSGLPFNAMALKSAPTPDNSNRAVPHNPCINAGAILSCSMVFPEIESREERLNRVINYWKELSGGVDLSLIHI